MNFFRNQLERGVAFPPNLNLRDGMAPMTAAFEMH
jgi:hypothetical protein